MAYEWPCLERTGLQREFAALIGATEQVVSEAARSGLLEKGATLRVWLLAYIKQLRAAASGRATGEAGARLTEARVREANAKAFKAEVETGEKLGLLVSMRIVEPALRNWAARGSQSIESAAERIVEAIESEFGINLEDCHVRDHLRTAQRDIAAYAEKFGADAEASGDGMDAARTGTDG